MDHREGSKQLVEPLKRLGLPASKSDGDIPADLMWEGRGVGGAPVLIGVEYKKLEELVQSLRTERLQGHQVPEMHKHCAFFYLIVQGEIHVDAHGLLLRRKGPRTFLPMPGKMSLTELYKRLFTLHLGWGLSTLPFVKTQNEALRQIEALYRTWTDKDQDQHTSHIAIYSPPTPVPISEFRKMFKGINDVGIKTTKAIEAAFKGSVRQACVASRKEWLAIDGVGPKLYQHIHDVLEGTRT